MAHPLGDERRLEVGVCDRPRVVDAAGELERALDVLARRFEVRAGGDGSASASRGSGAQEVARKPGALGERERLVEEVDRGRDARELVAADSRAGTACRRGRRPRTRAARRARARPAGARSPRAASPSPGAPSPRRRARAPRARPTRAWRSPRAPRGRGRRPPDRECDSVSASARASIASMRLRTSVETPRRRNSASTPSRSASHAIVSPVGRVLPRSIWLMYSFENRSPASSSASARQRARSAAHAAADAARGHRPRGVAAGVAHPAVTQAAAPPEASSPVGVNPCGASVRPPR